MKYENYNKTITKIERNEDMCDEDKYLLQYNINTVLTKEDHMEIIKIVADLDKKYYTSNKSVTFFDLADLPNNALWKLHYYVDLCLDHYKRNKHIKNTEDENTKNNLEFQRKIVDEIARLER
jgi:hypothetical protein